MINNLPQSIPTQQPTQQEETGFEQVTKSVKFPIDHNYRRFNTLFVLPKEKSYENLEKDERVILFIYKHLITLAKKIIVGVFFVCVLLIGLIFLLLSTSNPFIIKVGIVLAWYWACFIVLYFFIVLVSYLSDVYIITNERIIAFDIVDLVSKNAQDIDLQSIHSIQYVSGGGLFKGMINYGDVVINYIGGQFILENVALPNTIALVLGELVEARKGL